jgi:hypothetical protein
MRMKKEHLVFMRLAAISLSCLVATLTLFNLLTVVTHGIDINIPEQDDFTWAVDPIGKRLLFITDFTIKNHGAYDIEDIDMFAKLSTRSGASLLEYSEENLSVPGGADKTFEVTIPVDFDELRLVDWFPLLFKDTVIELALDIDAQYMLGLVHVTVDEVLIYDWHAPLSTCHGVNVDTLLALAGLFDADGIGGWSDASVFIIERAMELEDFELAYGEFHFDLNVTDMPDGLRHIACDIITPVGDAGILDMGFTVCVGLPGGEPSAGLKEVRFEYVRG